MDDVELLRELVAINSVFPNEKKIAEYVEQKLKDIGFLVQRQPISDDRFNILAERGTEGNPILLYAHLDTVPPYGNWETDPLELREEGDRLYGLGAYDIKSGIAAIIQACSIDSSRKIKVGFGVDEENNSAGGNMLANSDFLSNVEGIVATEILDFEGATSNSIMLGRRGRTVIELEVPGKSAHGGHAEEGINAISEAARLVPLLGGMKLQGNKPLPDPNQFIRKIAAESTSLSVPDSAIIEIDRHMIVPETPETVRDGIQTFVDSLYDRGEFEEIDGKRINVRVKQREVPYLMPYVTSEESELVKSISRVFENPKYVYGNTVADENVFAATGLPVVSLGAVGGNEHQANEWVSKSSYLDLIGNLREYLQQR